MKTTVDYLRLQLSRISSSEPKIFMHFNDWWITKYRVMIFDYHFLKIIDPIIKYIEGNENVSTL